MPYKINKSFVPTKHVRLLIDALQQRGIHCIAEYADGHKHVDIAILKAKLFIEVDGLQHFTSPDQILRDFRRDHYSDGDDFSTIHIPNIVIEHFLDQVADAICEVARIRV